MKKEILAVILIFSSVLFLEFFVAKKTFGSQANNIVATTKITICGDGVVDSGEQCDSGSNGPCPAACSAFCAINSCGGGNAGGGGGGGGVYVAPQTAVIFSGKAYPLSKVGVLKDGQPAITTIAGPDANFSILLSGLSSGDYIFAVFGEDSHARRSSLFTFPIFITQGATTQVSGIFISPTIAVDKSEVKRGDNIAIFGQSIPNSEITISVNSDEEFFNKIKADANGVYLYNFDTSPLAMEQHFTKSKSALSGQISSFSKVISFVVGAKNVAAIPQAKCPAKADLNNDCKVNLVDFSIAAYWYKRPISADFAIKEKEALSGDGKVDLVDFSIMAFYWTG
ncbi:MAG: hypothetical protein Q7R99_03145 [bacterium]|nr:hypothetical protein [bacterium]